MTALHFDLDVVLPWRDAGCPFRRSHFQFLLRHYGQRFNVIVADPPGETFNRSTARNFGVARATAGAVAVIDADNYIDLDQLAEAAQLAADCDTLVKPFTWFGYMSESATNDFYAGRLTPAAMRSMLSPDPALVWEGPPGRGFSGGAYVMKRDLWTFTGGFDESFEGWGAEDDAFTIVCTRVLGTPLTVPGIDFHLWHPAQRWTSAENYKRLMDEYVNNANMHIERNAIEEHRDALRSAQQTSAR